MGTTNFNIVDVDSFKVGGIAVPANVLYASKASDAGGSATVTITATGVVSTDICFASIQASTNPVSIQKVTPSADTITVLLSGDPGAGTRISWQALRPI